MKRTLAGIVLALACVSACGAEEEPTPGPTDTADPTPTAEEEAENDDLVLAPGRIGPVEAGMTRDEAAETGLFETDVQVDDPGCERVEPLLWSEEIGGGLHDGLDVLTDQAGTILTMGVREPSDVTTEDGIGLGSTYGELVEVYGDAASAPVGAGFLQVGVFVQEGDDWLGALLDHDDPATLADDEPITFLEVTDGVRPDLIRDGC